MYGALDISTSGMIAQRTRMEVTALNIANADTINNAKGEYEPYLRRAAMLAPSKNGGVQVIDIDIDPTAVRKDYRPHHPNKDAEGNILVPDIDPTVEWVNGIQASRAYEANIAAAEATKSMLAQSLRLLA